MLYERPLDVEDCMQGLHLMLPERPRGGCRGSGPEPHSTVIISWGM